MEQKCTARKATQVDVITTKRKDLNDVLGYNLVDNLTLWLTVLLLCGKKLCN